ncbi:unnamed protein product [Clonostachys chloroleuca]|uniref:Uncharacterized protein n=1 Tax=Clonostachys chloroleuca TaxID=1926264 RepID=A0AA35Q4G2_9HYPO|nr:unnamed protein product [Clonostachys chloroleuca]
MARIPSSEGGRTDRCLIQQTARPATQRSLVVTKDTLASFTAVAYHQERQKSQLKRAQEEEDTKSESPKQHEAQEARYVYATLRDNIIQQLRTNNRQGGQTQEALD